MTSNFPKSSFRPVHGLIFLFKWRPGEESEGSIVKDSRLDTIFFARQVKLYVFYTLPQLLYHSSQQSSRVCQRCDKWFMIDNNL